MASVELSRVAAEDLERLIHTHSLPPDTKERVRNSLSPLAQFPKMGAELGGRWAGFRFLLGPWRWLLLVYVIRDEHERVIVVTIQDARSSHTPVG